MSFFSALTVRLATDDESMIQTESSYQNLEPLPDIIDICQPTEPKSIKTSRVVSRNLSPNLRNQRSKSYANALRLQPYDQDPENKS